MSEQPRPQLSIVVPARDGIGELGSLFAGLLEQARGIDAEVIVAGGPDLPAPEGVTLLPSTERDILKLRLSAMLAARGALIAIGEDHAGPDSDWCEAAIRAHREHPGAQAIVGCLVNATDATIAGRANFLSFAAPWQPPMSALPPGRPPPVATLIFKREALAGLERPGQMETELVPDLFNRGLLVADQRVRILHYQDHGVRWAIANGFWNCRTPTATWERGSARSTAATRCASCSPAPQPTSSARRSPQAGGCHGAGPSSPWWPRSTAGPRSVPQPGCWRARAARRSSRPR